MNSKIRRCPANVCLSIGFHPIHRIKTLSRNSGERPRGTLPTVSIFRLLKIKVSCRQSLQYIYGTLLQRSLLPWLSSEQKLGLCHQNLYEIIFRKYYSKITRDNLFIVLIRLSGLVKKEMRFLFQLEDRPGSVKEVTHLIRSYGGSIARIMGTYERAPAGSRMVFIRAYDIDRNKLPELQEKLKQQALMI